MNVYFSCSITGGRSDQQIYAHLVDRLLADGHQVPTAILASPEVSRLETVVEPRDVYERDTAWVEGCDALVAEVSTPSHGVGYEIALALLLNKPVLCLYRQGRTVSKMITGNTMPTLQVSPYVNNDEAIAIMTDFLRRNNGRQ